MKKRLYTSVVLQKSYETFGQSRVTFLITMATGVAAWCDSGAFRESGTTLRSTSTVDIDCGRRRSLTTLDNDVGCRRSISTVGVDDRHRRWISTVDVDGRCRMWTATCDIDGRQRRWTSTVDIDGRHHVRSPHLLPRSLRTYGNHVEAGERWKAVWRNLGGV